MMQNTKYKNYTIVIFEQEPNVEYPLDDTVEDLDPECLGTHGYRIYKNDKLIYEDATNQWDHGACLENAKQDIDGGYVDTINHTKEKHE